MMPKRRRINWGTVGFVATLLTPGLLLYGLLVLWPMAQSFYVAVHRWRGVSGNMVFVGLENFAQIARDDRFRGALSHNFTFFLMVAAAVLTLSLFFANVLANPAAGDRGKLRGGEFFRALFLFPNVVSVVAVSTLWMFLYNPNWGLINATLEAVGGLKMLRALGVLGADETIVWLANPRWVLPSVAATYVWYVLGFYILLFRAGIQNIPADVIEAAMIDGATETQRFWHVTMPLLKEIVRLSVIYLVINSMNIFALVWIMAPPSSTANATEVALTYLYQKGFVEQQFGYSTAIGAVNFVLVMIITTLLQRVWRTE